MYCNLENTYPNQSGFFLSKSILLVLDIATVASFKMRGLGLINLIQHLLLLEYMLLSGILYRKLSLLGVCPVLVLLEDWGKATKLEREIASKF